MAAFFWIHGGGNSNWNTVGNWSATSGGGSNGATPGASDDVTFDGAGTHGNDASIVSTSVTVLSLTFTSGFTSSLTINAAQNLTVAGNFTDNTAHSWVATGGAFLTISAASTISSGGKTFPSNVTFTGANTKTLAGGNDWTISGTLTISGVTVINLTTAEKINCAGLASNQNISGTSTIVVTGGTWSGTGTLTLSGLTFNGNVTLGSDIRFNTGTLTWSSGTITNTGSTLTVGASTTFNTNGMSWNNITSSASSTLTLNSLLTIAGTYTINNAIAMTFSGTSGFSAGTLTILDTTGGTQTFKNGVTYSVTSAINAFKSTTSTPVKFVSASSSNAAFLNLSNGATCNLIVNFTDIDASGGRAIWTFNGTLTRTVNIFSLTDLTFVNGRTTVVQGHSNY